MKKKIKIDRKDLEKLKPITLASKEVPKKTEEEKIEEDEFLEEESSQRRRSSFDSPVLQFKAPILEKTNVPETLESEISNAPLTSQATAGVHKELTYVQNLPKYSGADYSTRTTSEMAESRDNRQDREVNIARTREFTAAGNQQNRAINMGLWQRENVFNRPDMNREEDDRDYVLQAREKKDRDKLPFQ